MVKSRNSKVRYLLPGRRQNKLPPLEELPCNSFFPTLKQGIDTKLEIRIIKGSKFTKLNPNKWTLSLNFLLKLELCFDRRAKLKRVREVRWEFPSGRSRENFPVDEYFKFLLRSDSVLLCHKWKKKMRVNDFVSETKWVENYPYFEKLAHVWSILRGLSKVSQRRQMVLVTFCQ